MDPSDSSKRVKKLLGRFAPLLSVTLFAAALGVLHREIAHLHYGDVKAYVEALPAWRIGLALASAVAGFVMLTRYDWLAFRHLRCRLDSSKIALASFVGYAFSNSLGYALLTGVPIRLRFYSTWKVSTEEIAQVAVFGITTYWLGFCALAGVLFTASSAAAPASLPLPFSSLRPLGPLLLLPVAAYLAVALARRKPLAIGDWLFEVPRPGMALAQILVAALELTFTASVLYWLLPAHPGLGLPVFLTAFLLAMAAGVTSQIPGGLGVFETAIVLMLSPPLDASELLGALVVFRLVYYLLPLTAAALLLGTHEVWLRRHAVEKAARAASRWGAAAVPPAFALTTFAGGAVLLFSGATPIEATRLSGLRELLPLSVIETSHFIASLAGIALMVLAHGLQRRIDAAYHVTVGLLAVGAVASLLKGLEYEEAIILSLMLVALVPCHGEFYRRASVLSPRLTFGWLSAIAVVLIATVGLLVFSYNHVEYSSDLWWRFAFNGNAPRSLRAMVGVFVFAFAFGLVRLLRARPPEPALPGDEELDLAAGIVAASPRTYASLALLGDKYLLMNDERTAFLMYGIENTSWVTMGAPVGPPDQGRELLWRFRDLCDRHAAWPVFYQVPEEDLGDYLELGMSLLKLGETGEVPLAGYTLEGAARRDQRKTVCKLEDKEGCRFEWIPRDQVAERMDELKAVSDAWMAEKDVREKGFSLGRFDPAYLCRFPAGVVFRTGRIIAFTNVLLGGGREELSCDLIRYLPEAPNGVMEYLLTRLMLWGAENGYRDFSLGMAPLAGLEQRAGAPTWNRVAGLIYRHGEHFYNFQGLRAFKEKFDPQWEPRYLASPGGLALPRILANVATLIAGGLGGVFSR